MDSFFTKRMLKLNVKVEQSFCESRQKHFVLFRLTPKPFNDNIWEQLAQIQVICE